MMLILWSYAFSSYVHHQMAYYIALGIGRPRYTKHLRTRNVLLHVTLQIPIVLLLLAGQEVLGARRISPTLNYVEF